MGLFLLQRLEFIQFHTLTLLPAASCCFLLLTDIMSYWRGKLMQEEKKFVQIIKN